MSTIHEDCPDFYNPDGPPCETCIFTDECCWRWEKAQETKVKTTIGKGQTRLV